MHLLYIIPCPVLQPLRLAVLLTRHGIVRIAWQIAAGQLALRADAPEGVALEIELRRRLALLPL
ncbi:hypothetical protein PA598K_03990 [Paenibacillus sp. 598K]|nr:hypothetical protein PA598K_03990 [Paenibacillus sp. 598K]